MNNQTDNIASIESDESLPLAPIFNVEDLLHDDIAIIEGLESHLDFDLNEHW
jgi:hypothetical protein